MQRRYWIGLIVMLAVVGFLVTPSSSVREFDWSTGRRRSVYFVCGVMVWERVSETIASRLGAGAGGPAKWEVTSGVFGNLLLGGRGANSRVGAAARSLGDFEEAAADTGIPVEEQRRLCSVMLAAGGEGRRVDIDVRWKVGSQVDGFAVVEQISGQSDLTVLAEWHR